MSTKKQPNVDFDITSPSSLASYIRRRLGVKLINDNSYDSFKVPTRNQLNRIHKLLANRNISKHITMSNILYSTLLDETYHFFIAQSGGKSTYIRYYNKTNKLSSNINTC